MANEVRLIEELRRLADLDPPICSKDKASEIEVFGRSVTVYCKPFEQFQNTLRQAADRIEELESFRPKGRWRLNKDGSGTCSECHRTRNDVWDMDNWDNFCSHCGAKMEG